MTDDKRNEERRTVNLDVRWDGMTGIYEARLEDISLVGCFINTTGEVEIGQEINLEICLPSGEWMRLSGTVTWHQVAVGFGMRFAPLSEPEQAAVKELLAAR